jgi:hypothetical protein
LPDSCGVVDAGEAAGLRRCALGGVRVGGRLPA